MFTKLTRGLVVTALVWCTMSVDAAGPTTFAMPDAVLLFGRHNEIRVVTPDRADVIHPPAEVGANHGYFAYPSISPRGDLIAWGFARELQPGRSTHRARYVLGLWSLADRTWTMYGDFDDIGATAFSRDGSKVAFVAQQQDQYVLLIFDIATKTMTTVPHPTKMPGSATLSWSPDAKRLAVEIQRGDQNPLVAVLDLESGNVRPLGEGFNPAWSPSGEWIAYFEPGGATCFVVHPDGTGVRVVKKLRQIFLLTTHRSFGWGGPVWSPDSRRLLLDEMKGDGDYSDTVLLDVESGRDTTMAKNSLPIFGWAARPSTLKR